MAECTALACPRLQNTDPSNRALSVYVQSAQIIRDKMGHNWCNFCWKQRELMDYGKEHHWPEVHAVGMNGRYALLPEYDEWYISVATSKQDAIDAYYAELIGEDEESA